MKRYLMLAAALVMTAIVNPALSEEANIMGVGNMQCPELTQIYAKAPGKMAII